MDDMSSADSAQGARLAISSECMHIYMPILLIVIGKK